VGLWEFRVCSVDMRVRILGSAAGGGLPQWNCQCRVCEAARESGSGALPRTQSSVAVRGTRGPWFLLNASPDVRQQLADFPASRSSGLRATSVGGVLLTDAEIDHTAGLLLLRESSVPLRVWSTEEVRAALSDGYPLLRMLERYCGVDWSRIEPERPVALDGSSLEVEAFATGGDAPLYIGDAVDGPGSIGLTIRDRDRGVSIAYVPALDALVDEVVARLEASDCVLVDGTFWTSDELVALGIAQRDAAAMGHAPLGGPEGSLARLSEVRSRIILVHVNNTNPILLEDSPERALVEASGVEVSYDGLEFEL
jgi:pyrroloquinoline quinone biosynthesis protein B